MASSIAQAGFSLMLVASAWAKGESLHAVGGLEKRAGNVSTTLPGTWTYQGCYTDPGGPRTLSSASYTNSTAMTEESCIAYCDTLGYTYAGTEYSQECYCGNAFSSISAVAAMSDCNMVCSGNSTEVCGGPSRLSVFWNGKTPPPGPATNPGALGYGFYGCYSEGTNGRALTTGMTVTGGSSANTVALCISACSQAGYSMAGVEYADECYCGNSFSNGAVIAPGGISDCSMTCSGNSSEFCGAGNRLDVYKKGYTGSSATVTLVSVSSTSSTSASTTPSKRSISSTSSTSKTSTSTTTSKTGSSSSTSTSKSTSKTSSSSSTSTTKSTSKTSSSSSTSTSKSTSKTTSSSSISTSSSISSANSVSKSSSSSSSSLPINAASSSSAKPTPTGPVVVQSVGKYVFNGCWTEATNGRALTPGAYAYDTMTVESCASNCAGYTYFGVEYGRECYCGNTINAGSTSAALSDCSFPCAGSGAEYCGAGNRLDMYVLNGTITSSSTSTSSSTTASQSSTATGLPTGWKYAGCYSEGTSGRALSYQQTGGNTNTVENCVNTCTAAGYTVAGLEFSSQCFCDNCLQNGAAPAAASKCNMACSGNANEICGAGDILSIYNTGNLTVYQPPVSQNTSLPGNWTYEGCWSDNVNNNQRVLIWQSILTNNNSATTCLSLCAEYGYMAAGMEYGEECYCGDDSFLLAQGSTKQDESTCDIVCSGNKNYYCGGNNRLSYYRWTGTPINVWHTPTGADAGSYQFLVGGVVVPLITTTGINNKVVFMEKAGTGAPNTTGTYELDLAQINNFTGAWRPLHVKTDIFCSAGVTLPDKAGRQLNIGGWSGSSTYGVRIYWPDGSPGVWGQNDWQENVNELSLLAGRWYPSAMIMANGSILVLGGEVGSNSAPTPSCEILPLPPGGYAKYLDWLDRTDPNNLYPFMFVLPSGGIFVVYYNEARIIDEVTFDTTKTLPNLPGSVINFLAGRSYPLEGTGVLLPQYPPYSAPVTVLVCGGSANGAAMAIDNCVSTQPEVASPTWTLERMPSQRVMSCICALPDGTYLILNGAQQGVAGFGLATNPNYGAVLYDPTLQVNQRFSIMATTIVARLYHSEAVLLPDGRVLVSGSDPEDGTHPEEYRVEVFNPPYALSGATPPSYTIQNVDWTYGGNASITANIPSGNLAGVRVTMMAAVSSTHGNSMGQRTLFLAVSCSGAAASATCLLTAPPSAHVAPPGWYQIFVLDGKMPGTAHWVRIGGSIADAANIGNWPAYSDFKSPGLGPVGAGSYHQ